MQEIYDEDNNDEPISAELSDSLNTVQRAKNGTDRLKKMGNKGSINPAKSAKPPKKHAEKTAFENGAKNGAKSAAKKTAAASAKQASAAAATSTAPAWLPVVAAILAGFFLILIIHFSLFSVKNIVSETWFSQYKEKIETTFGEEEDSWISRIFIWIGEKTFDMLGLETDLTDTYDDDIGIDQSMLAQKEVIDKGLRKAYGYASGDDLRALCEAYDWWYDYTKDALGETGSSSYESVYCCHTDIGYCSHTDNLTNAELSTYSRGHGCAKNVNYGTFLTTLNLGLYGYRYDGISDDSNNKEHTITAKRLKNLFDKNENLQKLYSYEILGVREIHDKYGNVIGHYGIVKIHPYTVEDLYDLAGTTLDSMYDCAKYHTSDTQSLIYDNDDAFKATDYGFCGQDITNEQERQDILEPQLKAVISNDKTDTGNLVNGKTVYATLNLDTNTRIKKLNFSSSNDAYLDMSASAALDCVLNVDLAQYDTTEWYSDASDLDGSGKKKGTFDGWMVYYDGPTEKSTDKTYTINVGNVYRDIYTAYNSILGENKSVTNYWCSYEFGSWKSSYQGVTWIKGAGGSATANGRYLIAVAPGVVYRDYYSIKGGISNSRSWYNYGNLDMDLVLVDKRTGEKVYVPVTTGDAKGHSYPFGMMQTGIATPQSASQSISGSDFSYDFAIKNLGNAKNSSEVIRNYNAKLKAATGYSAYQYLSHGMVEWCYSVNSSMISDLINSYSLSEIIVYNSSYSSGTSLTKDSNGKSGQDVTNYAAKFVGNPYVYGGTSLTKGCDCSGYIQQLYAHFGYSLPHSSADLRSVGKAVSYHSVADLKAGDIICYSGHVGLYDGNGMIYEAKGTKYGITHDRTWNCKEVLAVRRIIY